MLLETKNKADSKYWTLIFEVYMNAELAISSSRLECSHGCTDNFRWIIMIWRNLENMMNV